MRSPPRMRNDPGAVTRAPDVDRLHDPPLEPQRRGLDLVVGRERAATSGLIEAATPLREALNGKRRWWRRTWS
jgi:hypothetical protein